MERKRDEVVVEPSLEETQPDYAPEPEMPDPEAQDDTGKDEEESKPEPKDPIMEQWNAREKGPSDEQIAHWKEQFGECYLMSFDPRESYVWRPVTRLEYKNILQGAKDDAHFSEMVVQRCVLWPEIDVAKLTSGKAGTIPTLHGVIMEGSNFLDPDQAVMLVRRL